MSLTFVTIVCAAAAHAEMQELLYAASPGEFDITTGGGLNCGLWLNGANSATDPPTHFMCSGDILTTTAELLGYN